MVNSVDIRNNLQRLDQEYNNSISDNQMTLFFSKLAVMEFCGWIEESIDSILNDYIDTHIVDDRCKKIIRGFIKQNHGFDYESNTYKIFAIVLGADNWENILDTLSPADRINFENLLKQYSKLRNKVAHTYTGVTTNYNAPSQVFVDYNNLLSPILNIESEVHKL